MAGFVYIMSNPLFDRIKIGRSIKDPSKYRLAELNSETGSPEKFKCEYYAYVEDENAVENYVHKKLDSYRPQKRREFFEINIGEAIETIRQATKKFGGLKYEELFFEKNDNAASPQTNSQKLNDNWGEYLGSIKDGLEHGYGVRKFKNGNIYSGEFKSGVFEGRGELKFSDGSIYKGSFVAGKFSGKGTLMDPSGQTQYEGEFLNGSFHGQGKTSRYEGNFKSGKFHGEGTLRYSNGNVYQGAFENSKRHGYGRLTYPTGNSIEGPWQNDQRNGKFLSKYDGRVVREQYVKDKKVS